jgi:NADPH-dependent 2,4-dienoyl-CoA reductase/sulfur reductase-like enzyme/nitrite reductase/ring-hydroxylating ferredoxin subunit
MRAGKKGRKDRHMNEKKRKKIADKSDLNINSLNKVTVDGEDYLVVPTEDGVHVCGNSCPHAGASLHSGHWDGETVTCPWHNSRFDVKTGEVLAPPSLDGLQTYKAYEEEGSIYIGEAKKPEEPGPVKGDFSSVLIVGGGAAGNAAAERLRREGFEGKVTMLTQEHYTPYDRTLLSKGYTVGKVPPESLPLRNPGFYKDLTIELKTNHRVQRVDGPNMTVHCENGAALSAEKILLATGGRAIYLDLPGSELPEYLGLRGHEDAERMKSVLEGKKDVTILGASFIGMELASDFVSAGCNVVIVAPEEIPLELIFGKRIGSRFQDLHESNGVTFHLGTKPAEITGVNHVEGIKLEDGTEFKTDVVISAVGIAPEVEFLRQSGFTVTDGIEVDEKFETEMVNIYAAGDMACYPYPQLADRVRVEHWAEAERQAQQAVRGMLGRDIDRSTLPFFWTEQFTFLLKYIGFPVPWSQIAYSGNVEDGAFLAGFYKDDKLIGIASYRKDEELLAMGTAIRDGQEVPYGEFGTRDEKALHKP